MSLPQPRNISPLIRLGRWSALLGGVYFGYTKFERLKAYDAPLREKEIQRATAEHEAHLKEKERIGIESMATLAKEAGIIKN